jgi:putative SOS response-associated peptidase YedK
MTMCGRFTLTSELNDIMDTFEIEINEYPEYKPRFNIPPTSTVAGILDADGKRVLRGFKWGLIPFWASSSKVGYSMINARAETIQTKPAYRNIFVKNRIVIPSDGFYEWRKEDGEKQPYRIQLSSEKVFGFAGLYDTWKNAEGEIVWSCTIITTTPNRLTQKIHDRMPVILDKSGVDVWLNSGTTNKEILQSMLTPYSEEEMKQFPVSKAVNYVKNQESDLIKEVAINSK